MKRSSVGIISMIVAVVLVVGIAFSLKYNRSTKEEKNGQENYSADINKLIANEFAGYEDLYEEDSEAEAQENESEPESESDEEPAVLVANSVEEYEAPAYVVQNTIACWGDSMMQGVGVGEAGIYVNGEYKDISFYDAPYTLQEFTSFTTYNFGVGGETSYDIALRAGGIPIYTNDDIYITYYSADNTVLVDEYGNVVYMEDFSGYGYAENDYPDTVYINDVLCLVEKNGDGSVYISICEDADSTGIEGMFIPAGTRVIPKAAYDHRGDILVLEIGSNGGWDDYYDLIEQYKKILDYGLYSNYIIVGDTDDPGKSYDGSQGLYDDNGDYVGSNNTKWEQALQDAFGNHFLNTRVYLLENALSDCGLEPTENDIMDAEKGILSEQIRSDYTHFNSYGYYSKGKAIYLKGVELGYWN